MAEFNSEAKNFDWLPEGKQPLADGDYDAIVMGTGLTECCMSGLLSTMGKKVLVIDRNNYYGGECASLNLNSLFQKFKGTDPPASLGRSRDYNVDLVPKFIMACGNLVKILLHTKVTRYLDFNTLDGSYVYKGGKLHKVPATAGEALQTSLMGMFEKRRFRKFLVYLAQYDEKDPNTYEGKDLRGMSMRQLFADFGLDENTQSFAGHAMALQRDESYLDKPAIETVKAVQLYCYSVDRYGKSPYIYPLYGLGGLPEGFSRLSAIHGGTFMLDRPVDEILYNEDGKAWGIRAGEEIARAPQIIGDPSYFGPGKCRRTGATVRSICILDHPIPGTNSADSCQVIIPASQVGRRNDIYIACASASHYVAPGGKYVAIISTTLEQGAGTDPASEIEAGLQLVAPYLERFDAVSDLMEPVGDGSQDNCFISKSYDAASHFEATSKDILDMYRRVTGEELDMNINADSTEAEEG